MAQRKKATGSIMSVFQRGDNGKWYYRFKLNGKEFYRACKGASNLKEAKQYEAIVKAELMRGNLGILENKTQARLNEGIKIYLEYSENNKKSYKSDLSMIKHLKEFFNNPELNSITPKDIEDFKKYLITEYELKNSSVNRHLEALSKLFNLCISNRLIEKNPLKEVKKMKKDNYIVRVLSKTEEIALFKILPLWLKYIVICALKTGMRKSEILTLKWLNIDFKTNCIELLNTKSGKKRKIPLSNKLREVFLEIKKTNTSEYVFINPQTGDRYIDIKKSFNTAVKKADIKNFRFHDLRHTFATRLIEMGVDIVVVKELLGHASISTTMIYVHSDVERKTNAINLIDSY
jgi:integrase